MSSSWSSAARQMSANVMTTLSGDRAELPRDELVAAQIEVLAGGEPARGHGQDRLEDLVAGRVDRGRAGDDAAGVEVHVVAHPREDLGVRRDLDDWGRLAAQ